MKLHYYPVPDGNFGDYLNEMIWEKYLPVPFDDNDRELFVGIGTLLNDSLPKADKIIVFGSGVGYGGGLPSVDHTWKIYALRGPLSAQKLGQDASLAVTDPAVLMHRAFPMQARPKRYKYSYIPHVHCMRIGMKSWQDVCNRLGIQLIDPRMPVEKVVDAMAETEIILAEAMHGAILADTYSIPWIPIVSNRTILPFKWQDWCYSLGLEYEPQHVIGLWDPPPLSSRWLKNPYIALNPIRKSIVTQQLRSIVAKSKPVLSDRRTMGRLTDILEEKLELLKANELALAPR